MLAVKARGLSKSARFVPIRESWSLDRLAAAYVSEVVRYHGVPSEIVSDRDPRFCSRFWRALQEAMGSRLLMSSAFHAATDGQSERTIQTLEDMLRACTLDFHTSWEKQQPLVEFSYNNSFHTSIGMAPYEALYGRKCRSPLCWDQIGESRVLGPALLQETVDSVRIIRDRMKTAQDRQKSYADSRRRPLEFAVGDMVFLRVSPWKGVKRFGIRGKLSPKFIGPFPIISRVGTVAYRLELPSSLGRVHDVFHVSQLRKYISDPSHVLQSEIPDVAPNLTFEERPVRILDRSEKRLRNKVVPLVRVFWICDRFQEETWETEESMRAQHPFLFE